jgi:hypothetical protein
MCAEQYKGCSTINLTFSRGPQMVKREQRETFLKLYCPIPIMGYPFMRISKIIMLRLLNMGPMECLDTILASNFGEVKIESENET